MATYTFKQGQKVIYNQGRGFGLTGTVIKVDNDNQELVIKAESTELAFRRSFTKVRAAA